MMTCFKTIIAFLAVPAFVLGTAGEVEASPVFQFGIIPCGNPGEPNGCGSNLAASDPLSGGKVTVARDGKVRVSLIGAVPNKTYLVLVHNWISGDGAQPQFAGNGTICIPDFAEISSVTTNASGNFSGRLIDPATGKDFVFPAGVAIGQPNFAFNEPDCTRTQFTTGFIIP